MNSIEYHKIKQLAHKRTVWILLLCVWLFSVNIALVHAQEHPIATGYQCQLCLTNFGHTPFIPTSNISYIPVLQDSFIVELPFISAIAIDTIITGNRDPPHY